MSDDETNHPTEHVYDEPCPHCGCNDTQTVDTEIGRIGDNTITKAIVECQKCGQLWGEERDFYGVFP